MISPFSTEEKQKLIETLKIEDKIKTLIENYKVSDYIKDSFDNTISAISKISSYIEAVTNKEIQTIRRYT